MTMDLNLEKLVYESKRVGTLLDLKRLLKDNRYEMACRFFPNTSIPADREPEFQISRKLRMSMLKELDKQIKDEGTRIQNMFNVDDSSKIEIQSTEP